MGLNLAADTCQILSTLLKTLSPCQTYTSKTKLQGYINYIRETGRCVLLDTTVNPNNLRINKPSRNLQLTGKIVRVTNTFFVA